LVEGEEVVFVEENFVFLSGISMVLPEFYGKRLAKSAKFLLLTQLSRTGGMFPPACLNFLFL
jgi:hypothetical protein